MTPTEARAIAITQLRLIAEYEGRDTLIDELHQMQQEKMLAGYGYDTNVNDIGD